MNIKRNLKYILSGSLVVLIIYMFLAAFPTGPSMYIQPVWTVQIPAVTADAAADQSAQDETIHPFRLGERYGYFSSDGTIALSRSTKLKTAISSVGWAEYPSDTTATEIFTPDGNPIMTIAGAGFVHLEEARAFLFMPGGDSVSQFDATGTKMWTREHVAPITAFSSSHGATVIGYADGALTALTPEGTELFSFYPGGSDHGVILGTAVSEDGSLVACVSGIERQRFLLIKISGKQHKIVHHEWLEGNLRRQVTVAFESSGKYAFFECAAGLGVVDCSRLSIKILPISGTVVSIGKKPGDSLFAVLSQEDGICRLSAIERPWNLVASAEFSARDAFLIQEGNALYLGTDDRISRMDIRGLE